MSGVGGQSKFEQLALRMMDPIFEIYTKDGMEEEEPEAAEEAKEEEASNVKCMQKMAKKNEFLKGLPNQIVSGSGNEQF